MSLAGATLQKLEEMHDQNEASALTSTYLVSSSQETWAVPSPLPSSTHSGSSCLESLTFLYWPGWFSVISLVSAGAFTLPAPPLKLLLSQGRARGSLNTPCIPEFRFIRCHPILSALLCPILTGLRASVTSGLSLIHLLSQGLEQRWHTWTSKCFIFLKIKQNK